MESIADVLRAFAAFDVVPGRTEDAVSEYVDAINAVLALRTTWTEDSWDLPSTDMHGTELSVAELAHALLVAEFTIRRTTDGFDPSRPAAVDALRLCGRAYGCLEALGVSDPYVLQNLPVEVWFIANVLANALFELARCMVGYVTVNFAPDVEAGRDEPDAWLNAEGTAVVRRQMLHQVVVAHRVMIAQPIVPEAIGDMAISYSHRIAAIAQVASIEVPAEHLADRIQELGWLNPSELADARRFLATAVRDADQELVAHAVIGQSIVALMDGKPGAMLAGLSVAAERLSGRNLISTLRTMLSLSNDAETSATLIEAILAAAPIGVSVDSARRRASALQQILAALGIVAVALPDRAVRIARQIAAWPDSFEVAHDHLWLLPSMPPIGLIEMRDGACVTIAVPGLADFDLIAHLSNDFAEEPGMSPDPLPLRRSLVAAIDPLRDALSQLSRPATYYPFGFLKHVPLAALTGRGEVLASRPGLMLFAGGPPPQSPAGGRLFIVDEELTQSAQLQIPDHAQQLRFNSDIGDPYARAEVLMSRLAMPAGEIFYFGHGHVDPFRLGHSGLILGRPGDQLALLPAAAVATLNLRATSLAVVMACGAGQGNVFVEPSLSLGHAFRIAGAELVIAPQWPILAEVGLQFIERFLTRIDSGESYIDAWAAVLSQDPNRFMSIALLGI